ncbi:MAG: aromatic ring-hydroxylating dioxygenase subunit alpha [Pseudomonadota bacterium]
MGLPKMTLDHVLKPIGQSHGLPNAHYTDESVFNEERQSLFFKEWAAVGFASDVPEEADAVPVDFLGMPLLLVRDRDDIVRVFQNTCRHRGMILVDEPKKVRGVIRCPYHSWCYSLDGKLKTTPHVGGPGQNLHEDVNRDELGLYEVRSHLWQGIVFVNVSGDASAFEDHAASLLDRWSEFEHPVWYSGSDSAFELDVQSNWKLAIENYCESYHLPWIHPGLNSYSRLEDHYNILQTDEFSGQGTMVYNPSLEDNGKTFSNFPDLNKKWDSVAEYIALFPNVLLGVHRDHRFAILILPQGPERSLERIAITYASEAMMGEDYADLRKRNTEQWHEIFAEDIEVVEGMQKGRHGPMFDGGKFSPVMDESTWCFHQWAATRMNNAA